MSVVLLQNCGQESAKWVGKCPSCNEWNTFVEEVIVKGTDKAAKEDWRDFSGTKGLKTISINDVVSGEEKRIFSSDGELNRVLGGGIVAGSIVLVAGEPCIGKSTLFSMVYNLQMFLYMCGEKSNINNIVQIE
jgi:DNA repair protein RadA/Sms